MNFHKIWIKINHYSYWQQIAYSRKMEYNKAQEMVRRLMKQYGEET